MMNIRAYFSIIAGAATLALAACAAPENQMLDQARAAYSVARNDPRIIQNAPTELNHAAQTLQEAESLFERDAEERQVTHQAYLANQHVAIAREAAQLKMTQDAIAQSEVQRQQVLLQARSREAEMARQQAARSQKELEQAQSQLSEAEKARQAELAQQRTQQFQREAARREEEIAKLRQQVREAETRETPRGIVLSLKDVVFPVDKADLNPGGERTIGKIADFLKQHPDRTIAIEGFTDSTGSSGYNRELSERRAEAVQQALVRHGVEAERITAQGFGEQYPVASNETPAGRQLNRRVEIVISDEAGGAPAAAAVGGKGMEGRAAAETAVHVGMTVRDRQGQQIGEVTEVMTNFANGRASFARVSSADGKSYLVPLSALTSEQGNVVTLNVDRNRIETSPLPRQGMSEEQYGRELYEHYGLSYPWEDLPGNVPVR